MTTQQPQAQQPAQSFGEQIVAGMIDGMKQYNADPEAYESAAFERSLKTPPVSALPAGFKCPELNPDGSVKTAEAQQQ